MKSELRFYKETYLTVSGFKTDYLILDNSNRVIARLPSYKVLLAYLKRCSEGCSNGI